MSTTLNPSEYLSEQNKILNELSNLENRSFETKKSYILRLRDTTRPLIESGYYEGLKLNDLCSFIYEKLLLNHGITVSRNDAFYELFTEEEKHHEKNPLSLRKRQKISSLPLEKQTGDRTIDTLKQFARADVKEPHDYEYTTYLKKIVEVSNQTLKHAESLLNKLGKAYLYSEKFDGVFPDKATLEEEIESVSGRKKKDLLELYELYKFSKSSIKDIEETIGVTADKIDELNEILAEQKYVSKKLDERNKITFLEKWNAIVANIETGISAIAKKLSVNKKHLTNNVRPTNNPVTGARNKHHDQISWFTHLRVVSPSGEKFVFDAKDYFDQQLERGKLHLSFRPLILKNCEVSLD